jgi:hypothetical protein
MHGRENWRNFGIAARGGRPHDCLMRSTLDRRPLALLATALLVVAACSPSGATGPGSAASSGAGPGATGSAGSGQLAAALLPVSPVAASSAAVSGLLEPGSPLVLDAVGPDGAKFHAEFPEGAATVPVTVTMQPLQSIGGLSGAVEAVSFEPSGVMLVKPAVLTIDGPVASAITARGFGYQMYDAGAFAAPAITASGDGPLRLVIGHFSGYGATADDPPQWTINTITATEASDIVDLEGFVISNAYHGLRNHNLSQSEADTIVSNALDAIAQASQRLGDAALATAEKGDVSAAAQTELNAAITVILESARADQLLGRPGDPAALQTVEKILDAYLAGVTKHCTTTHDVTVLNLLLGLSRQAQLLGSTTAGEAVIQCTSGEVHFQTTITGVLTDPGSDNASLSGTWVIDVRAPINLFDGQPSGDVPFPVTSTVIYHSDPCNLGQPVDDSVFTVVRVFLKPPPPPNPPKPQPSPAPNAPFRPTPPIPFTDASVQLSIGNPTVHFVKLGGPHCDGPMGTEPSFTDYFDPLNPGSAMGNGVYLYDGGFEIPGNGSEVLARRTIDQTFAFAPQQIYTAHTVIEIIHTP